MENNHLSIDELAQLVANWHTHVNDQLDALIDIPDSFEIKILDDLDKPVEFTAESRKGFIHGLQVAKGLLGSLPFEKHEDEQTEDTGSRPFDV